MRRMLILVAALALLTAACKIEVNAHFTINADRSGEVTLEMGFDDEVLQLAQASGESPESMFSDFNLEDVPGATTREERRGDMTFYIVTVPIEDLTQAEGLAGDLTEGLADNFEISFDNGLVTVEGSTTLDNALGDSGGDLAAFPPEMMADIFSINIIITMPGKVLDHNATSKDGSTLTWAVDLAGGSLDIYAQSDPAASESGGNVLLYVLIAAGAVLVLAVLWLLMRKRGGSAPAAQAAVAAGDAPPPPPPAE